LTNPASVRPAARIVGKPTTAENTPNSAGPSKPTARPAVSQAANGKQGSDTGKGADIEYELPTAADVAAELGSGPADLTEGADDESEGADGGEGSEESAQADALDETPDEAPDESADGAAVSDDDAADAGDETEVGTIEETGDDAKPAGNHGFQQRIDTLTARAKDAEEEAATLREQLATTNHRAPDPMNPFALADTESALETAIEREESFLDWTLLNEGNPEGADLPDGKGGTVHYEPDQIRQMKVNTNRILRQADKRRAFLKEKVTRDQEAAAAYPWLRQLKEGDGAEVQKIIEARPEIRQRSDYRLFAADAVVGAKLRKAGVKLDEKSLAALAKGKRPVGATPAADGTTPTARQAAARVNVAPIVRRTAPSPSRPGVLPPRMNSREASSRQADKTLQSSDGSLDSIGNAIAAKWRL